MITKKDIGLKAPSNFAKYCLSYLESGKLLLDLGCGNCRDSKYFIKNGIVVLSIDKKKSDGVSCISFEQLIKLDLVNIDYIYMRWSLHAIKKRLATKVLKWAYKVLKNKGKIFIEARSINDDLYGIGQKFGKDGFIHDHYRRFIRKEELLEDLIDIGFNISFETEERNFSIMKDNSPCLIRIIAKK